MVFCACSMRRIPKSLTILAVLAASLLLWRTVTERGNRPVRDRVPQSTQEEVRVTLIEGWTTRDMAAYLEREGVTDAAAFLAAAKNFDTDAYPTAHSRPRGADLEGYLFPDTYRVFRAKVKTATSGPETARAVIRKALENFETKFTPQMSEQARGLGLSVHEALTLASIVERETGRNVTTEAERRALDDERRTVAGIFLNRLKVGMPLESDATVNYVTGKDEPSPQLSDLEVASPYNTYKNPGLPPGPICNPSLSSIAAVLDPKKTAYFYFLHKQPSGEVVYSRTFEEHVQNKLRYLK